MFTTLAPTSSRTSLAEGDEELFKKKKLVKDFGHVCIRNKIK